MRNKWLIAGMGITILLLMVFAGSCNKRKKKTKLVQDTTPPVTLAEPPGGSYQDPVSVTLTSDEPATIYYTTDGSEPTATHYADTGPSPLAGIDISENTTLQYFGIDESDTKNEEAVKSQKYIIGFAEDMTPPTTTANPPGGTYNSTVFVWLFVDEAATIYYTTDGSTPDNGSDTYADPIEIAESTTLKFFAIDNAGNTESVKTERYYIGDGPDIPWPMRSFDVHHTGRSPYTGSQTNNKKWEFDMGGRVSGSSAAIGEDGTIYCGSDAAFHAINPDGTLKWLISLGGWVVPSPTIGPDGTIYVGCDSNPHNDYCFYAINPDGTHKWKVATGDDVRSSPAIGPDGTIYFGSDDNKVYAINPDGSTKWTFTTGHWASSSPVIGDDGIIYIGSNDGKLYALNPADGGKKWEFVTGDWIHAATAIGSDGTIYVGSRDCYLYALNPADGSEKWKYNAGSIIETPLGLAADGTIYVTSCYNSKLHAVNPDGTKKWEFLAGGHICGPGPIIDPAGTIYFGSSAREFYAINPDGSLKWQYDVPEARGPVRSTAAIAADGTIYFGTGGTGLTTPAKRGALFAIGE
jgi:outer membrane protein assembly factor BamB